MQRRRLSDPTGLRAGWLSWAVLLVSITATGCGAAVDDAEVEEDLTEVLDCGRDLPEPSDPCLAGCGNELFVGQPCSEGGGECTGNGFENAWLCTVDFDDTGLGFCTLPCVVHEDCGTGAICTGDPENPSAGAGCFPLSCWDGMPVYAIDWTEAQPRAL